MTEMADAEVFKTRRTTCTICKVGKVGPVARSQGKADLVIYGRNGTPRAAAGCTTAELDISTAT